MDKSDYFLERNIRCNKKLSKILSTLPYFCEEYFIGIENKTSYLTRINYANDLKIFFYFLTHEILEFEGKRVKQITLEDLEKITSTHLEIYLNYLTYYELDGKVYTNNEEGKNRKLSSIRSLLKYFFNKDKIKSNVSTKVESPKIHEKPIIRLEVDEIVKLLDQAENPSKLTKRQASYNKITKIRDVAILTLLLGTGIRVSECVGINIDDIDFEVNGFKVTRKGGNQMILYFSQEVANALKCYIEEREKNDKIDKGEKALFLSLQNKRISVRAVEQMVKKYSSISVPLKKITPHKLRSTFGTNLYRETNDIYIVADVLGHKDVNTTKKHYAAISEDSRKKVANVITLRDK